MKFLTDHLQSDELLLKVVKTAEEDISRGWVPAYYFAICLPDGTEIGQCDLRIGHNRNTYYGGNIGYGISEPYRGHHYAAKACRVLFKLAKKHGMGEIVITCRPDNVPSRKTCEALGCMLETIADLPEDNDMYLEGMRQVCIYRKKLGSSMDNPKE